MPEKSAQLPSDEFVDTGVHEWIESCDTIQPDGEEEEQLEKLLARDWHE